MQRMAFLLRVRADKLEEYDEAHRHVWPDLLAELQSFGVRDYSIFRREQDLFLYLRVPDREQLLRRLEASEVNRRWQARMAPIFEPVPSLQPGEQLALMREVFFFAGHQDTNADTAAAAHAECAPPPTHGTREA